MSSVALIAHDHCKGELIGFVVKHKPIFKRFHLITTGTTGRLVEEHTGLQVERLLSGPLGGDQQIGARIADEQVIAVFFFRDPLTAQPHEPDVAALLRLCDVHNIPLATNIGSATALVYWLEMRSRMEPI